jgi:hypothetical protein
MTKITAVGLTKAAMATIAAELPRHFSRLSLDRQPPRPAGLSACASNYLPGQQSAAWGRPTSLIAERSTKLNRAKEPQARGGHSRWKYAPFSWPRA